MRVGGAWWKALRLWQKPSHVVRPEDAEAKPPTELTSTTDGATDDAALERGAEVIERDGRVYFHSWSATTAGVWIMSEPFLSCSANDSAEVERHLRTCLSASRTGVPHPTTWGPMSERLGPLLRLAKVRSYRSFNSGAKVLGVRAVGGRIILEPSRNTGRGWEPLPGKERSVSESDEGLGAAVIETLAVSK